MSDEEEELIQTSRKKRKVAKNQFIDDEAELSGDDIFSDDESDVSDADAADLDLVDKEAPELNSDEEEEVRGLYLKQLETEDKKAVLLLQEHLEDRDATIGQRRRRKFRWQTNDIAGNSLRRHYDPNDDDSQEGDEFDDDDLDFEELKPRLKRPTAESLLLGSTRLLTKRVESGGLDNDSNSNSQYAISSRLVAGTSAGAAEDSNSQMTSTKIAPNTTNGGQSDLNRFLFRDKELVKALSSKETMIVSREEKDKVIEREIKRVLQSKSIFDQLYS